MEATQITIERAVVADAEAILFLQKSAYRSEAEIYNDDNIEPLRQSYVEIKNQFDDHVFIKALVDGQLVGSVRAFSKDGTCYIGKLIVHPDYQNQGIGKMLMHAIETAFESVKRFELFTGDKSEKNLLLYGKLGYVVFKTEEVNQNLSLVFMEKFIP